MALLHIIVLIFEGLLGVFSIYTAYSLFSWTPPTLAKAREALHYPRWYWMLAGVVASIGGIGLFVGLAIPAIGALAAVWMIAYFVVATFTHLLRKDVAAIGIPIFFLVLFLGLTALRWSDLTLVLSSIGR
jgi:hypothetical protein